MNRQNLSPTFGPDRVRQLRELIGQEFVTDSPLRPLGRIRGPNEELIDALSERGCAIPANVRVVVVSNHLWVGVVVRICAEAASPRETPTAPDSQDSYRNFKYWRALNAATRAREQAREKRLAGQKPRPRQKAAW